MVRGCGAVLYKYTVMFCACVSDVLRLANEIAPNSFCAVANILSHDLTGQSS